MLFHLFHFITYHYFFILNSVFLKNILSNFHIYQALKYNEPIQGDDVNGALREVALTRRY